MQRVRPVILGIVVIAVLGGCGDDGGDDDPGATTAPTTTAAPAPTTEPPATTAPPTEPTEEPTAEVYEVQQGDTLWAIADRFGTTVDAIVEANGIDDPSQIFPGDELVIPTEQ